MRASVCSEYNHLMLVADQILDPEENARVCERIDILEEVMSLRQPVDCGWGCFIH